MILGFDAKRLFNNYTGLGNHSRTTIDILTEYFPGNAYRLYTPKVAENDVTRPYLHKEQCVVKVPSGIMRGGLWRTFGLAEEAKADGVELFHGLSNELPVGIRRSGIPSVVTIHDVAFHTFKDMYHWQDRKIYDTKWRYAVKNADRIIAISECTKKDIIRFYGVDEKKIDVVYQPVNPRYYMPMDEGEATMILESANFIPSSEYMLYVGSINSRKNLLGIVKAMELLPRDLQMPLIVVGAGREYKDVVLKYIKEHGMEHLFVFPSEITDGRVLQALYTKARMFVYPSFYEGFGLPIMEALLSGCPVVTSNVSCLPEAGGPFSLQADPTSAEDIRDKMQKVLTDDALASQMITEGRRWAMDTFHPEVLAKELMKVYEKVVI